MGSFSATYWLAVAHGLWIAAVFLITFKPMITSFHWFLLTSFLGFVIRPVLAASVGGFTNYDSGSGWGAYNWGMVYQLIFMCSLSIVYLLMNVISKKNRIRNPLRIVFAMKSYYVLIFIGIVELILLIMLGGGEWLPGVRGASINTVVPGAKYIFPFAIMAFSIIIPISIIGYIENQLKLWICIIFVLVSFLVLSLLFMRGMVIAGVCIVFWAMERQKKLKYIYIIIGLISIFSIGQALRPIGEYVAMKSIVGVDSPKIVMTIAKINTNMTLMEKVSAIFLYTTNIDLADSWPVVLRYVDENNILWGKSFIAIPARFLSTQFRIEHGVLTGSDLVNTFYYGAGYLKNSFGFNVTLVNELYLNFNILGLIMGVIPGVIMGFADRWLSNVRDSSITSLFIVYIIFRGFTNELAVTIQWSVGAFMLALIVSGISKISMSTKMKQRAVL